MANKSLLSHFEDICKRVGVEYSRVIMPLDADEHTHQAAFFDVVRSLAKTDRKYEWVHAIPNGAKLPWMRGRKSKRFSPQAMRLKKEGLTPGVSDVFVPYPVGRWHGLYIEFKRERRKTGAAVNKPTELQVAFLNAMRDRGYAGLVVYGAQEAICALELYLNGYYDDENDYRIQSK